MPEPKKQHAKVNWSRQKQSKSKFSGGRFKVLFRLGIAIGILVVIAMIAAVVYWRRGAATSEKLLQQANIAADKGDHAAGLQLAQKAVRAADTPDKRITALLRAADLSMPAPKAATATPPDSDDMASLQASMKLRFEAWNQAPGRTANALDLLYYQQSINRYVAPSAAGWDELKRFADRMYKEDPTQWQAAAVYAEAQLARWSGDVTQLRAMDVASMLERFNLSAIADPAIFGRLMMQMLRLKGTSDSETASIRASADALFEQWQALQNDNINSTYWRQRLATARVQDDASARAAAITELRALQPRILAEASAETCFEFAEDLASTNRELKTVAGTQLVDAGVEEAIPFLRAAQKRLPDAVNLVRQEAHYLAESGRFREAVKRYQTATAAPLPPLSGTAYRKYRDQSDGFYGEAAALLSIAEKEGFGKEVTHAQIDALLTSLRSHPTMEPRALLLDARLKAMDGQLYQAAKIATDATTLINSPQAMLQLGLILVRAGEIGAGAEALAKAIPRAGELGAADRLSLTLGLARIYLRMHLYEPAAGILEHARTQLPENQELAELALTVQSAYLGRMRSLGDPAAEIVAKALQEEIDKFPGNENRRSLLNSAYLIASGNPQRARSILSTLELKTESIAGWGHYLASNPTDAPMFAAWLSRQLPAANGGPADTLLRQVMAATPGDIETIRRLFEVREAKPAVQWLVCARAHLLSARLPEARQALAAGRDAAASATECDALAFLIARRGGDEVSLELLAQTTDLDTTTATWRKAILLGVRNQPSEAGVLLDQVTQDWPFFSEAWHSRAMVAAAAGDLKQAETLCRQALKVRPDRLDSLELLSRLRITQGDGDDAIAGMVSQFRLNPAPALLERILFQLEQTKGLQVAEAARTRLAREIPENYTNRLALAGLLTRRGQVDRAAEVLDKILAEQPKQSAAVVARAVLEYLDNKTAEASARVKARIDSGDMGAADWIEVAGFRQRIGDYPAIDDAFLQASRCPDADAVAALDRWADYLYQLGDFSRAGGLYAQLWQQKQDATRGMRLLDSMIELGLSEKAKPLVEDLKKLEPPPRELDMERARVLTAVGDRAGAEAAYAAAASAMGDDPHLLTFRGLFRMGLGADVEGGINDLKKAIEVAPNYIRARTELWYYHLSRQRLDAAEEALLLPENSPLANHPAIQVMRGILAIRRGDYAGASEHLFSSAAKGVGGNLAIEMLQRALEAGARFDDGLRLITLLLEKQPDDIVLLHNQAWYRLLLGRDLDLAVAAITRSRELAKTDQAGMLTITNSYALARTGKGKEAWEMINTASKTDKNGNMDPLLRLYRYEALRQFPAGTAPSAPAAELQAITDGPDPSAPAFGYYNALTDLAWRSTKAEAKDLLPVLQAAAVNCRTITESDVISANVLTALGYVQFQAGLDSAIALANLRQSSQLADGPAPHIFRGQILLSRGDKPRAEEEFRAARKLLTKQQPQSLHDMLKE